MGTSAVLAGVALLAGAGAPPSQIVLGVLLAFAPYALITLGDAVYPPRDALHWALALGALSGLLLVAAPPVLSDDLYRYLWDARVLAEGTDPYLYAPDDPALSALRDDLWSRINHPEVPTIYPPLAQLLFAAAEALAHAPWTVKLLALVAHLGTVPVVARLAGDRGGRAALLHALNPLALVESASSGHVDAVAGLALIACVAALLSNRTWWAVAFAAAAGGVKLVGLAIAPLVGIRDRRAGAAAILLCLLPLWPLLGAGAGSETTGGLGHYARRWRGNDGLFSVVEAVASATLSPVAVLTDSAPGHLRLPFLAPVLEAATGTAFDPRAAITGPKKGVGDPVDFELDYVAGLLARGAVLAFVMGLALALARRRTDPLLAARWVLLSALLLSPQVHPWYLLWLLPIEVAAGRVAGLVWSVVILAAYAPLDGWQQGREWADSGLARGAQHTLVLAVALLETAAGRKILGRVGVEVD